ncbi:MAG: SRPBCC family protein [Acidimicrobiales bacterium]
MATTRLDIGAPIHEVFAALADGRTYADWVVGAKTIRAVDDGFPAVGTRLHHSVGAGTATIDDITEVVECDPPHHLALRASVGSLGQAVIVFDLKSMGTSTSIAMYERPVGDALPTKVGRRADRLLEVRNAETLWRLKVLVEQRAGRHPSAPEAASRLPGPVVDATVRLFATIAVARQARSLHPRGVTLQGRSAIHPDGLALTNELDGAVVARFSRGIGLPHPFPDFQGVALRFVDAHGPGQHQDLLLASSGQRPVLRHLLLPTTTFSFPGYSTLLPYRSAGGLRVFGCGPLPMRTLQEAGTAAPIELDLRVASLGGAWQPAATLTLDTAVPDDSAIRFDPWNTSEALVPAGLVNRLRAAAYAASRAATP